MFHNPQFNMGDWVVVFAYLIGIIGLGLWFGKDQRTTRDYFLGSRNVPWWAIGVSIVAAETSALTIIGVPSLAYGGNLGFIQMVFGYVIARILLAIVMVPHYFKGEIYSPYQLFANAFGPAARQTAGGMFLLSETLAAGIRVYVVCIPLQLVLGVPVLSAIVLFVGLSLLYAYVGGVKAVIWTDAVQFGLFLLGGLFAVCYIPTLAEGGLGGVLARAQAGSKLQVLNTALSLREPFSIWMGLIGGTFVTLSSHGAEQLIVQRVLACKNIADGRKALVLSALLILPLFFIFLLVGVMLWVFYPPFIFQNPLPAGGDGILSAACARAREAMAAFLTADVRKGVTNSNDYVFPVFMITEVPHVLRGFLIVAILSAAMSSVSSALTSLASVSTMDFVKGQHGKRSEEFYLRLSKYSTVFWAGMLVLVAYLSRQVEFVFNAAFSLRGLTGGALLGGLLLAVFRRSGGPRPIIIGMLASLAVMTAVQLLPKMDWSKPAWQRWVGMERASTFSAGDLTDLPSLASRLQWTTNLVSHHLEGRWSGGTREALANYRGSNSDPRPLRSALVEDLNKIIHGPLLYEEQRFVGVELSAETRRYLGQNPQGEALVRLNRLLLEHAYPRVIARSRMEVFWPWYTLMGTVVTWLVAEAVRRLTRPRR
jgi:solute:Na+ symporter, SSS family